MTATITKSRVRSRKRKVLDKMSNTPRRRYPSTKPMKRSLHNGGHNESDSDHASVNAASESDSDNPQAVMKNMDNVDDDFPSFMSDPVSGLMFEILPNGVVHYLHGSAVRKYSDSSPALYHSNAAVRDITTSELLNKLGRFPSLKDRTAYTKRVFTKVHEQYTKLFHKVNSEATLVNRFEVFANTVAKALVFSHSVGSLSECYTAASGFLAKRAFPDRNDVIDEDAGYMGKTDAVLFFGCPEEREEDVACAIEFKYLKTPGLVNGHRWITVSGALLAQILQSMVGHDAPVALAMTEQGYKIFFKELDPCGDGSTLIYAWPPGPNFHIPDLREGHIDDGLRVLVDIVRIVTRLKKSHTPAQGLQTAPSTPDTPAEGPAQEPLEAGPSSRRPVKLVNCKKTRDKNYKIKTVLGELIQVKGLCLASRFSEEELDAIARLEKKYK